MKAIFVLLVITSLHSWAGPNASGGTQETPFEHDRAAVQTILNTPELLSLLKYQGRLLSLQSDENRKDVYILTTEKCEVSVKFNRVCVFSQGLPQCEYSSAVLANENTCTTK